MRTSILIVVKRQTLLLTDRIAEVGNPIECTSGHETSGDFKIFFINIIYYNFKLFVLLEDIVQHIVV